MSQQRIYKQHRPSLADSRRRFEEEAQDHITEEILRDARYAVKRAQMLLRRVTNAGF